MKTPIFNLLVIRGMPFHRNRRCSVHPGATKSTDRIIKFGDIPFARSDLATVLFVDAFILALSFGAPRPISITE